MPVSRRALISGLAAGFALPSLRVDAGARLRLAASAAAGRTSGEMME